MVMEGFVERGRSSQGRVPMCSLKFRSNTCVCYCFYCGRMFTILFKCLIDKTNREIELYALLVLFKCLIIHIKLVGFVNKTIAPLSSACTFTSFGVHENVKLQPTTIAPMLQRGKRFKNLTSIGITRILALTATKLRT